MNIERLRIKKLGPIIHEIDAAIKYKNIFIVI